MKTTQLVLAIAFLFSVQGATFGQTNTCPNGDFEDNSFQNWDGSFTDLNNWVSNGNNQVGQYIETPGFDPNPQVLENVHVITNTTMVDPYVAGLSTVYPDGGSHSLRLGNYYDFQGNNPQAAQSVMKYQITVPDADFIYTFHYAVVLEDPNDSHETLVDNGEEYIFRPFFNVEMFDGVGDPLECSEYFALADPNLLTDYKYVRVDNNPEDNIRTNCGNNCSDIYYRDWTTISIPLGDYVGQTLTIVFHASDCKRSGHLGYAYIDTECSSPKVQDINLCGSEPGLLQAPEGFGTYEWTLNNNPIGGDSSSLLVSETGTYGVVATTETDFPCKKPYYGIVVKDTCEFDTLDFCESIKNSSAINGIVLTNYTNALETKYNAVIQGWFSDQNLTTSITPNSSQSISDGTTLYALMISNDDGREILLHHLFLVNSRPNITLPPPNPICIGDSAKLQASTNSTGGSYRWYHNQTLLSDSLISDPHTKPTITTTYSIEYTDTKGCKDSISTSLVVNPLPTVDAGKDVEFCVGKSSQIQATGTNLSYQWTPNATLNNANIANPIITPLKTDTITELIVTATDGNTCSNTDTVLISLLFPNAFKINEDTSVCENISIALNTDIPLSSYLWSPASILDDATIRNPIAKTATSTQLFLEGKDENNCLFRDSLMITIIPKPIVTIPSVNPICFGDTVQLTPASNKAVATYNWYSNTDSLSNTSIDTPYANPANTTVYNLEITDTDGCLDTAQITVTVTPLPNVSAGTNSKICLGNNTQLQATGADSYTWTPSASLNNSTISNPVATPVTTTRYYVTGSTNTGCFDTSSVLVTVLDGPIPSVSITYDRDVCIGDNVTLSIFSKTNLGDAPVYRWHQVDLDASDNVISSDSLVVKANFEQGTSFYLEVVSNEICISSSDAMVTSNNVIPNVYQYPDLLVLGPENVCIGEPVEFYVTDKNNVATSFTWLTHTNKTLQNSSDTSYFVSSLTEEIQLKVAATNPSFNCPDTSSLLRIEPIQVFLHMIAEDTIIYEGTSTDIYFTTNSDTITLETNPFDDVPNLLVSPSYLTVSPIETTVYTGTTFIKVCEATDTVRIRVLPPVSAPYFFSPNDDGDNDVWIVKDLEKWPLTNVVLLNRWGMEVGTLGNHQHIWDGKNDSGEALPDGVYYYVIEAGIKDLDENKIINYTGFVTLTK